jgi:hypothetical protein
MLKIGQNLYMIDWTRIPWYAWAALFLAIGATIDMIVPVR